MVCCFSIIFFKINPFHPPILYYLLKFNNFAFHKLSLIYLELIFVCSMREGSNFMGLLFGILIANYHDTIIEKSIALLIDLQYLLCHISGFICVCVSG